MTPGPFDGARVIVEVVGIVPLTTPRMLGVGALLKQVPAGTNRVLLPSTDAHGTIWII